MRWKEFERVCAFENGVESEKVDWYCLQYPEECMNLVPFSAA